MKKIILLILLSFTSLIGYSQEGFESGIPATWTVFNPGTFGQVELWHATTVSLNVHSGAQAAEVNRENIGAGNTEQDWLVMPLQTIPNNGQLNFWTRKQLTGDRGAIYQIRISAAGETNPANVAAYTTIQSYTELQIAAVANIYEEKIVSLAPYAGSGRFIAFVRINTQPLGATTGDKWLVDDVSVVQQCLDPTVLSATAISATTAKVGWLNPGGAPLFDVQYGATPFTLGSGTIVPNVPNNYTLTGLTPGTCYQYYVRAKCTSGVNSAWTGPFNFCTTPLGATCAGPIVVGSLPFCQTSDTSIYGNNVSAASPGNTGCGVAGGYLAGNDVVYTYNPTYTGQVLLTMDPQGSGSTGMFVYSSCSNIGISCIGGVGNAGTGIRTITALNVTMGSPIYIVLSSLAATPTYPYTLCIQKVNCVQPINGLGTVTGPYTANLTWANGTGSTSTAWQYVVQTVPNTIPGVGVTGTTVTATNAPLTGLTPSTAYQFWVNATCADGTFSAWSGPYPFTTPASCLQPTGLGISTIGTTTVLSNWTSPGTATSWQVIAVTSPFAVPAGNDPNWQTATAHPYTITGLLPDTCYKFYVRGDCGAVDGMSLISGPSAQFCTLATCVKPTVLTTTLITTNSVRLGWTSGGTATTWQVLVLPSPSVPPAANATGFTVATTNPFDFTGLAQDTCYDFYVRGDCGATDGLSVWSAPKAFCTLATCPIPTALGTAAPLSTSINVTWTATAPSLSFEVIAVTTGSPAPIDSTPGWQAAAGSPYTYTGLAPLTCYDFYVRGVCSPTDSSNWAGPVNNCTQATPPVCGGTFVDAGGTTANYPNGSDSTVTICPTIPGELVTVTFTSFDTETNWDGLYVFDGSSTAAPQIASTNGPGTVPGGVPGSYWGTTIPGPFTSSSPDGCLTFRFRSDTSVNRAGWVSNVTCAPPPACPKATALTATATTNTATFSWTNVGPATSWQVIYLPCGSPAPSAAAVGWTAVPGPATTITISGLTSGTCFDFYVRSDCSSTSNGVSAWAGPKSVTTAYGPVACGGNFIDAAGPTTNYANSSDSTVTICPPAGQVVTVTFTQFDTETNWDGLYVFDGPTIASPQIASTNGPGTVPGGLAGSYWGTTIPGPFTSSSPDGCLTFRFRSDTSVNRPGWVSSISCAPAPTCGKPNALTFTNITPFTTTMSWATNAPGVSTSWQVLALPIGSPVPNSSSTGWQVATSNTNFVYTGLTPDTCYKYYVRGDCGATDGVSEWSVASAQFCTPPTCIAPTNLTVGLVLPNSVSLSWTSLGTATSWQVIVLPVGSPAPNAATTSGWQIANTNTNFSYTGVAPNTLSPDTAYQYYVRSDCGAIDGLSAWSAVSPTFTTPPTCPQPVNLGSTPIAGGGAAILTWDTNPTTSNWSLNWGVQGGGAPTGNGNEPNLNTNSFTTPSGLLPGFYEFYVRSNCTPGDSSLWSGPFLFYLNPQQPACAEVTVPTPGVDVPGVIELCNDVSPNCVPLTATYLDSKSSTSYVVSSIPFIPPFPFVGGTELNITVDDIWSAPQTLPFNFCFFGTNSTTLQVGSNGVVTFSPQAFPGFCAWAFTAPIPNAAMVIKNAIYGVYQDLNPNVSTAPIIHSINYQTVGTYPCRAYVVNFNFMPQFSCGLSVGLQTSQIVLYETSNIIEVYVRDRTSCTTWNSGSGLIGIQNAAGTIANVPPGRNTGPWNTNNEAWRFTPDGASQVTFTWLTTGAPLADPTNVSQNFCVTQTTTVTAQATYTGCGGTQVVKQTPILLHVNDVLIAPIADVNSCDPVILSDLPVLPASGNYYNDAAHTTLVNFPITATQPVYAYAATPIVAPATTPFCENSKDFDVIIGGSLTPDTTFTYTTPVCNNDADISPVTGTGFTPGGTFSSTTGLIIDSSTGVISVSLSTPGSYDVTYTVAASACQAAASTMFNVVINPTIAAATDFSYQQPACHMSGNLSPMWGAGNPGGVGTAGGTWSATPAGLTIDPVTGVIDTNTSTPGAYVITYTVLDDPSNCGTAGSTPFTFVLSPAIIEGSGFDYATPICMSSPNPSPNMNPLATSGGVFTSSSTDVSINSSTGVIDLTMSLPGSYTITYTVAGVGPCGQGSFTSFPIVLTNSIIADTNFSYTTPVCQYDTVNPMPITGTTFTPGGVYSSTTGLSINSTTGEIDLASSTAGTYLVRYDVPAGLCQAAAQGSATITINATITPDTNFSYVMPICKIGTTNPMPVTDPLTFTAGGTYSSTTGMTINGTTGEITLSSTTAGTYVVSYDTLANASTCQLAGHGTFTVTITAPATPILNFSYTTPVCQMNPVLQMPNQAVNFVAGGVYSSDAGLSINASTGAIDPLASTIGSHTITYTLLPNAVTCTDGGTSSASIVITTSIPASTNFSYATPVCKSAGTAAPIQPAGFTLGGTYTASATGLSLNASTGVIDLTTSTAGTYTVIYTITANALTCQAAGFSSAPITIVGAVTPVTDFTYNLPICLNGDTNPSPIPGTGFTTGGTYNSTMGIAVDPVTGVINLANSTAGSYVVTYSITADPSTCRIAMSTPLTVALGGTPAFDVNGGCVNGSYVLNLEPITLFNPAFTYSWTDSSNNPIGTNSPTIEVTTAGLYHLTVTNVELCSTTEDFTAAGVDCVIQKGISPNGDDKNESFDLTGMNVKHLSIFNRYGTRVYDFLNYNNEWHGQSDSGQELPDATYYYVLQFDSGADRTGWIYINKQRQ